MKLTTFKNIKLAIAIVASTAALWINSQLASAQQIGGIPGAGAQPPVGAGGAAGAGGVPGAGGGAGGFGGGVGGGGGGGAATPLGGDGLDLSGAEIVEFTDFRNQGFVGATGPSIQERGFIGPPGDALGPPLNDGASFGGNVINLDGNNQGIGGAGFGGNGGGFGAGRNGQGFGAFGQNQIKGFEIIRRSVRSNLRPQFSAPAINGNMVAARFGRRIVQQPAMNSSGRNIQLRIRDRVATLTGFATSQQQRQQLERQLRLEPGVDRIVNQIQLINQ